MLNIMEQTPGVFQIKLLQAFFLLVVNEDNINNHTVPDRMDQVLSEYFASDGLENHGLPTVAYIPGKLSIAPN